MLCGLLIFVIALFYKGKTVIVGKISGIEEDMVLRWGDKWERTNRSMSIVFKDQPAIYSDPENFYPDMNDFIGKKTEIILRRRLINALLDGVFRKRFYPEIMSMKEVE